MDAVSLFAPIVAPGSVPVVRAAVAEAGADFADVFASALVGAVPAPAASPEIAAPNPPDLVAPVDPAPPAPAAVVPTVDAAPVEGETSPPAVERPARRPVAKAARPPAAPDIPPDPPPRDPVAAAPTEEAAPEAPNAPAQEPDPKVEIKEEAKPADVAPVAPPLAAVVLAASVALPMEVAPAPSVAPDKAPSVAAASVVTTVSTKPELASVGTNSSTTIKTDLVSEPNVFDPEPVRTDRRVSEGGQASSPDESGNGLPRFQSAPSVGERSPSASALPDAPDLDATPQVSAAPAPVTAAEPKVANVAVAAQAAIPKLVDATSPEPEVKVGKIEAKTTSAPALELAVAEKRDADDKPKDDAPKGDASPAASVVTRETAATARPEAGTDRPSVDRHLVVRQVADRIESLAAARPREGVTVHLEPRDLGTVTLVVKGLASALDVQVFASDDRVRESLGASRPELAQALAPRGIELREIRVAPAPTSSATSAGGGSASANPDGRPRGGAQPQQPQSTPNGFRSAAPTVPRTRAVRPSGRGVDVLV